MKSDERQLGRREFLGYGGKAALGASALGVMGFGSATEVQALAPPPISSGPPSFIIDSHCHFAGTETWVEDMVRIYRPAGAMACANAWISEMELLKEAVATYPDVFIGYGRVAPDNPSAVREIVAFHEAGFLGVKFHSPARNWDDPSYFQLYRMCEHLGLHMLLHTGISSRGTIDSTPRGGGPSRMRPMYLDTICRHFPDATVQGAHFGNPWYDEASEAARWSPNLYFDLSGSTLYKWIMLGHLGKLGEYLWWSRWDEGTANPHTLQGGPSAWEHIVFGSDERPAGLPDNIERFQQLLDANNVPEEDRSKMWGLTMAGILGIDPESRRTY